MNSEKNLEHLLRTGVAGDKAHATFWQREMPGESGNNCLVGFVVDGRRFDRNIVTGLVDPNNPLLSRSGFDLDENSHASGSIPTR